MCGLTGWIDRKRSSSEHKLRSSIIEMTDALVHRGPDDLGFWVDPKYGLAFGHRRLAILDLSKEGHQPMVSKNGRFCITFNGEIYNFLDIRSELISLGHFFRGNSDTEVILAACEQWGSHSTIDRLVGMFSFALWDRENSEILLCRDRVGEKPLYYGAFGDYFIFASELKAIRAHPHFCTDLDIDSLAQYFQFGYIPGPNSIYNNIKKLEPGCTASITLKNGEWTDIHVNRYWSPIATAKDGLSGLRGLEDEEAVEQLDSILKQSVRQQMISDVPLGAFLSGGIDSSLVTALMQVQSSVPIKTFSIGFDDPQYNEAAHAKAVAQHLETHHTELYVKPEDAMSVIPKLPLVYDEPFADSSQIPTYLVSKMARQHVTVCLSGDGGDELFGGYNRYVLVSSLWNKLKHAPLWSRKLSARAIRLLSPQAWDKLYGAFASMALPRKYLFRMPGDKLHKLSHLLHHESADQIYQNLISIWKNPQELVINSKEQKQWPKEFPSDPVFQSVTSRMMLFDLMTYLPDDILVKVDRASMAVSLESRVPFLDHRVVEFSWKLNENQKIREGKSKWILRQVLDRYVPRHLIERPKMGFGLPIGDWMRGPLRPWVENLLDEKKLESQGYLNSKMIKTLWTEHLSGRRNWQADLWTVLMFQAWLEHENSPKKRTQKTSNAERSVSLSFG